VSERATAIEHQRTMTVEEYFQLEENDPDTRYEYIDGHVYAYEAFEDSDEITLNSLGVHFLLADVYTDVEFPEVPE
jgi:Uma2 family endonuclease